MMHPVSRLRRTVSALQQAPAPEAFRDDTWVGTAHAQQPTRGPKPALLLLAPGSEDPAGLRALVQTGTPARQAARWQVLHGGILPTATGLEALYRRAAPELHWQVRDLRVRPQSINFSLIGCAPRRRWYQWQAHLKPVFRCDKSLVRRPNGAWELHASGMFLKPRLRGRGLVVRCETVEAQLLRSLSTHPDTRLSLAAGYAPDPFKATWRQPEHGGYYAHGAHHYLFADEAQMQFPGWLYAWKDRPSDRQALQAFFIRWFAEAAQRQTLRHSDGSCLSADLPAELRARIHACRTPHDFAMLRAPHLRVHGSAALGKACLTSGAAPAWAGVRFVNPAPPDSPTAAMRERSTWGFAARALQEIARAR